ncbi:hypothetical protein BG53_08900 [Paenibacillus darwinianus]|uniref:Uncharacterized protein n=1 Tax=Paenibacillus darwinianus TaxID=1380763 RepID=A0A9W5W6J9_9BACL|nr:hypothetical protein [Paenibacillus darwinianus]EXX85312.1 hypothetical protein BG53_08900 [Paenibacillus darwinianus]EXX86176.1 hypothetical protein CH50_07655 [Paenibacillus darwinianus]EXX86526.1 hypothetical protein BG52_06365 [Paenibacillus darwinianus]
MVKIDERFVDHNQLKDAWQRTLPTVMNPSDQSEVMADEADPKALRCTHLIICAQALHDLTHA